MISKGLKVLGLVLLIPVFLNAQDDKEAIRKMIREFTQDVSSLTSEGGAMADKIMSYTSPKFTYENRTVNIMNLITTETMSKDKIAFLLNQMKRSQVSSKRTLGNLDAVFVRRNLALAKYEVDYELFEDDRMINRGHQWVTMLLSKNSTNEWKIETLNVLNADDITYKSTCICEIYETQGLKNIITETIVPDGHEVDYMEDKFSIEEGQNPRLVRHGFKDYYWDVNGSIFFRNPDGSQGRQVGTAKSRQELLLTLIQKEVYPDRCSNVIRKLK